MNKKKTPISFRIPEEEKKFLREYAEKHLRTQTELFREFIRWLEERDRNNESRF